MFAYCNCNTLYWISDSYTSIVQYNIDTEEKTELFKTNDPDDSVLNIYVSKGFLVFEKFIQLGDGLFNFTTEYYLMQIENRESKILPLDCLGLDFEYPYIVFHNFSNINDDFKLNLWLLNVETMDIRFIGDGSWGTIDDSKVFFVDDDWDTQICTAYCYDIQDGKLEEQYNVKTSNLEFLAFDGKYVIEETEDTGPDAVSRFYWYDLIEGRGEMIGDHDDWTISESFNGRCVFFLKGEGAFSMYSSIYSLDTENGKITKLADGQRIASIATGTIESGERGVVWSANYVIHFVEVET